MPKNEKILVVIPNLVNRKDRRAHICEEFLSLNCFEIKLVNAVCDDISGAVGLWKTLNMILSEMINDDREYFIFCEDDHLFTNDFSIELLERCIDEASSLNADVLIGGASWFDIAVHISNNLVWVKSYSGNQFLVIFKKFYKKILSYEGFQLTSAADYVISDLSDNKFLISPYISVQKEFGYSDVTLINNRGGRVNQLFENSMKKIDILKKVHEFYYKKTSQNIVLDTNGISLPVYKIHISDKKTKRRTVNHEFTGKKEFDLKTVSTTRENYWHTFRNCIKTAADSDQDVLIICNDSHKFSEDYNRTFFLKNVLAAYEKRCDILLLGIGGFNHAVPLGENLYWVDHFHLCNFMVIYKSFYKKILDVDYDKKRSVIDLISSLTKYKVVLFPFISVIHPLEGSNLSQFENEFQAIAVKKYSQASHQLSVYKGVYEAYISKK